MSKHRWTEADDLVTFYVYRFGHHRIARSRSEVAERLGIIPGSFNMRILNFKAIDGGDGLSNYARQSAEVYRRYYSATEPELRGAVLSAIEKSMR